MTGTQTQPTQTNTTTPPQGAPAQTQNPSKPYVPQGKPVNADGKTDEDLEKERQAAAAQKNNNKKETWWDRNKDWILLLIAALVGGALGYTIAKLLGDSNASAVNTLASNIDLNKKTEQPANANQSLADAGVQTPENTDNNQQQGTNTATPSTNTGRA